jgi:RHS repeat-associated protein
LTIEFAYNGDGARTRKTVGGHTTQYVLDLATTLPVVISDTEAVYLYGLDILAQQQAERLYYMHDGLGSVRQLVDTTGQIETNYAYTPFGVPVMGGDGSTPYQFTGEAWDAEVELLYLRARYYQPEVGRFVSRDPWPGSTVRPATLNWYSYVTNNPVNSVDPHGLEGGGPGGLPTKDDWVIYDIIDPLTRDQWRLAKEEAVRFQIPVELVAGAIAAEIVEDTDWWDPVLDLILEGTLEVHYREGHWDFQLLKSIPPIQGLCRVSEGFLAELIRRDAAGPGVANFHVGTAEKVEQYFAEEYPTHDPAQSLLPTRADAYERMDILLTWPWNIRYTAAYLRNLADYRKGTAGKPSKTPHVGDLCDIDMQIIFGGFRAGIGSWESVDEYQTDWTPGELGKEIAPFLPFYRDKLSRE